MLMANSAMSVHKKYSIMTNELIRRISNTQIDTSIDKKLHVIDQYTQQLNRSGYGWKRAREIIVCGLLGRERKEEKRKRNGVRLQWKASSTLAGRYRKQLTGNTDWYRDKEKDPEEIKLLRK